MAIKNQNANLKNVAIIMDGNGRWARKNSLKISQGHKKGVQIVRDRRGIYFAEYRFFNNLCL